MDISAEFLYGVSSVIGVVILLVGLYGVFYKVPVSGLLAILKEVRELIVSKADAIKAERIEKKDTQDAPTVEVKADENNEKGALL